MLWMRCRRGEVLLLGQCLALRPGDEAVRRRWMRGHRRVGDVAGDGRAGMFARRHELPPGHHRLDLRRQREHDGDVHGRRHLALRARRATMRRHDGRAAGRLVFKPCLEDERVELGVCAPARAAGPEPPEMIPASGDTGCAFPDRAALKAAVDNCLAVDPTGVACCSPRRGLRRRGDGRDGRLGRVAGDEHERACSMTRTQFNADISRWDTSSVTTMYRMFRGARRSTKISVHGIPRASRP